MENYKGVLQKMQVKLEEPVNYKLNVGEQQVEMNSLVGKTIRLDWTGDIFCLKCGEKTIKSFSQGFCYPCFKDAPEAAPCVLRPELCEAHLGIARDMEWAEKNCLAPHYVYLAISSNLKVGVTRHSQVPTRWIDQGASRAIKFAKTPNRHLAGLIEIDLKQYMSDKTSWQKMLKNEVDETTDILAQKKQAASLLRADLVQYISEEDEITEISYPANEFPTKIKSVNLDKEKSVEGKLIAIKGQYLLFEGDKVINIRKYGGYVAEVSF